MFSVQADPRSPEHGHYGFLQDLVRQVAYETLSKRERKARHLATATHLEEAYASEQEVVEVLASHYVAAYEAARGDADAGEVKQQARGLLARAGERARSLAANGEAQHYFEQAASLAEEPLEQARLLERAGEMSLSAGGTEQAQERFEQALALFDGAGERHQAARVAARLGDVEWRRGRLDEALDRMERAFVELEGEEPDADVAGLAAELGRLHGSRGELELASARIETALELAESLWLPDVLAHALITKGLIAGWRSRSAEALGLTQQGLALALEYELPAPAVRGFNNVADLLNRRDRCEDAVAQLEQGLALARRVGDRVWEAVLLSELSWSLALTGRWPEAVACLEQVPEERLVEGLGTFLLALAEPLVAQGKVDAARQLLLQHARFDVSPDVQQRTTYRAGQAVVLRAERKEREALVAAQEGLAAIDELGPTSATVKIAFPQALEAALALGERGRALELLEQIETLPPGRLPPSLRAHALRFRARLAAADGDSRQAQARFRAAASIFREFSMPFWLGLTLFEHGEWLEARAAPEAEPLLAEAREIFERLEATPWLERVEAAEGRRRGAHAAPAAPVP